jgi:hypothetical protein
MWPMKKRMMMMMMDWSERGVVVQAGRRTVGRGSRGGWRSGRSGLKGAMARGAGRSGSGIPYCCSCWIG